MARSWLGNWSSCDSMKEVGAEGAAKKKGKKEKCMSLMVEGRLSVFKLMTNT